jgi:hypothetical protein
MPASGSKAMSLFLTKELRPTTVQEERANGSQPRDMAAGQGRATDLTAAAKGGSRPK